ncbi:Xaa-Pro aminopeptidase [Thalassomonas viridans]|uniref:Xaa-Pro aminopeptidase n=2 Tax=Thalassomonas viridans TaxID=137584 RepID=A0AAE9Z8U8_9GAMM|nr:Xaa-Pro aminopeptidase [Thalassomonas viridans]WDE08164.1 Xaa-Pro aminopeptidase [Thalassomonas viridans]
MKHTLLPVSEFTGRRQQFFQQMPENSVALFAAAKEVTRSNDTEYPFCQDKNFYYLTGFNEPDALLVLIKQKDQDELVCQSVLFCREKNPMQEIWHGRRVGPELASGEYGFDASFACEEIDELVPKYLEGKSQLMFCQGADEAFDRRVLNWNSQVKATVRQGGKAPAVLVDCSSIIEEMRLIKSPAELDIMRKVNRISGQAHQRAMEKTAPGKFEYQIEAELLHEFARHGARHAAYGSIVAGGDNANILHYTDNCDALNDNELLLIDAGGELAGYAADITRTFPVNGKFTKEQKAVYQLVLEAQELAIQAIAPGKTLAYLNEITCEHLTRGLHGLGILTGDLDELITARACKKFFIHGLGHWLGLDVHDVGDYQVDKKRQQLRSFEPGMVMTIEPGLYIPLHDVNEDVAAPVDEKWRGIGVRIEDNILVTENGYENLTVNAPKTIEEIETLMAKAANAHATAAGQ